MQTIWRVVKWVVRACRSTASRVPQDYLHGAVQVGVPRQILGQTQGQNMGTDTSVVAQASHGRRE